MYFKVKIKEYDCHLTWEKSGIIFPLLFKFQNIASLIESN